MSTDTEIVDQDRKQFDEIKLRCIARRETKSAFTVVNKDWTEEEMNTIIRLICFYSVSLFETDFNEQKFIYKVDGEERCKSIYEACFDFYKLLQNNSTVISTISDAYDTPNETNEASESSSSDDTNTDSDTESNEDYHEEEPTSSFNERYIYDIDKRRVLRGIKLFDFVKHDIQYAKYKGEGVTSNGYPHGVGQISPFFCFELDRTVNCKIEEMHDDEHEDAGNYGDCIEKCELLEKSSSKDYVSVDLNEFDIQVQSNEGKNEYYCIFTPKDKIHHAASMFCNTCIVSFETRDIYISKANSATVKIKDRTDDTITLVSEYYGLDCL